MKEQLISVSIADRPYRLSVGSEGEEYVFRRAARLIEDKMKEYGSSYAFRDKQDLLAMVALQYVVEALRMERMAEEKTAFEQQLEGIDRLLDEGLIA